MGSFVALTAIALATWPVWHATPGDAQTAAPEYPGDVRDDVVPAAATASHSVYRHSVIAGGAHNRQELVEAVSRDQVVADHYRAVSLDRVRVERLTAERRAYVSYRLGDRVYWTKHKVTLPQGEPILTDGVTQIRARCGNCISYEPQLPTSDEEPDALEFDALAPPHEIAPLLAATPRVVPSAVAPSGRAASSDLVPSPQATALSGGRPSVSAPGVADLIPTQTGRTKAIVSSSPVVAIVPDDPAPPVSDPDELIPGDSILGGLIPGGPPSGHTPAGPGDVILYPPIPGTLIPRPAPSISDGGGDDPPEGPIQPVPVPEPGTIVLLGTGVAGALWRRLRLRRRRGESRDQPGDGFQAE